MTAQFTALRSSVNHEWQTPRCIFDPLHAEFNFTIDAAASVENSMLPRYWDLARNALFQDWDNERVWCNPPYGRAQRDFIHKASLSKGLAVLLIPARTDTLIWHSCIHGKAEVRFVKGRIQFIGSKGNAPFASAVVIFNGKHGEETKVLKKKADHVLDISYDEKGSVEGVLERVNGHGANEFMLYDTVSGRGITCYVDETLLDEAVRNFWKKRVEAIGTVRYRRDGQPISIRAREITKFPEASEIPSLEEMRRLLKGA